MNIGGFDKLTLLDYPEKVACIIFTNGCNFRCPFCHNAGLVNGESINENISSDMYRNQKADIEQGNTTSDIYDTEDNCRQMTAYNSIDENEIFAYLEKRKNVLDGVVITGGEPLIHDGIEELMGRIKAMGYDIKLDTNGTFPNKLASIISKGLVDYVAVDIKQTKEKYGLACGIKETGLGDVIDYTDNISKTITILKTGNVKYEYRTTYVKGIHDISDASGIAEWIAGEEPYYIQSYVDSGEVISPGGLTTFSQAELEEILELSKKFCPNAAIR